MKHSVFWLMPLMVAIASSLASAEAHVHAKLDSKMKPFSAFLGNWQAEMAWGKDKVKVLDVASWTSALNGKALKSIHSVNDGDYGGESFIFWDKKSDSYKAFYFTTADFYTEATISLEAENKFSVIETVAGSGDGLSGGISQVKSTSEIRDGKLWVSTSYLKNQVWTKPQTRVYQASQLSPKFK